MGSTGSIGTIGSIGAIVSCGIYPAIGIARVGNSPNGHFIGPEVSGYVPPVRGGRKDRQGRIKRQVARFRIYGFDARGNVVREIRADEAEITWTVHVANTKGSWYRFHRALDLPGETATTLRNAAIADRSTLEIDGGARTLAGPGATARLDGGRFFGSAVSLGRARTDARGRLLVFGGLGKSGSPAGTPITGLNNDGWYDDCSDGPVDATVKIGGRTMKAEGAWVIVAPPDFAPGLRSPVTLYDIMEQVAFDAGWLTPPECVSFVDHVLPTFEKLCDLQWVNAGVNIFQGFQSGEHFAGQLDVLSNPSRACAPTRRTVFQRFRHPRYRKSGPRQLPPMYGDGVKPPITSVPPEKWLTVTPFQYECLRRWAKGDFDNDWNPDVRARRSLGEYDLQDRPDALTRGALDYALGGAFHPGCEMTWPSRHPLLYSGPFRIKRRSGPPADPGAKLSRREAIAAGGPLDGSGPGDLTRWMAVPWQVDTANCGSGYEPGLSSYLPTFWPARVPNHVLTARAFRQAQDHGRPVAERIKHFNSREDWLRDFPWSLGVVERSEKFLREWHKVGVITRRDWPHGGEQFPTAVHVEEGNEFDG